MDHFAGHAGYDGVMLDLPGSGAHLEFTATEHTPPPAPHAEALLVLLSGQSIDCRPSPYQARGYAGSERKSVLGPGRRHRC